MALAAGTIWEVRDTGNANNGGGYIDRIPGTSIDYSQQNGSQLSVTDLVGALASVTVTSVIGGFTAGMVGNLIQIRGGVNFTTGFYEIVQFNSANSINLDRVPATGAASGGLAEVGGALISPETFILNGVSYNKCFVKSGTYNWSASRTQANSSIYIIGYDTSRDLAPTGNNRPLFALGAFEFLINNSGLHLENIRWTGGSTNILLCSLNPSGKLVFFNCRFENTKNAGSTYCIHFSNTGASMAPRSSKFIDCEFIGTAGATSHGFRYAGQLALPANTYNMTFLFCFFHDLSYGFLCNLGTSGDAGELFFKCTFARIALRSINLPFGATSNDYATNVLFCSFYQAGEYHINIENKAGHLIYGNTFENAVLSALRDNAAPSNNDSWIINSNDFWNNGASVIGCNLDENNIGLDPLFVNPAGDDFNFGPGSPCINNALGIRLGV